MTRSYKYMLLGFALLLGLIGDGEAMAPIAPPVPAAQDNPSGITSAHDATWAGTVSSRAKMFRQVRHISSEINCRDMSNGAISSVEIPSLCPCERLPRVEKRRVEAWYNRKFGVGDAEVCSTRHPGQYELIIVRSRQARAQQRVASVSVRGSFHPDDPDSSLSCVSRVLPSGYDVLDTIDLIQERRTLGPRDVDTGLGTAEEYARACECIMEDVRFTEQIPGCDGSPPAMTGRPTRPPIVMESLCPCFQYDFNSFMMRAKQAIDFGFSIGTRDMSLCMRRNPYVGLPVLELGMQGQLDGEQWWRTVAGIDLELGGSAPSPLRCTEHSAIDFTSTTQIVDGLGDDLIVTPLTRFGDCRHQLDQWAARANIGECPADTPTGPRGNSSCPCSWAGFGDGGPLVTRLLMEQSTRADFLNNRLECRDVELVSGGFITSLAYVGLEVGTVLLSGSQDGSLVACESYSAMQGRWTSSEAVYGSGTGALPLTGVRDCSDDIRRIAAERAIPGCEP